MKKSVLIVLAGLVLIPVLSISVGKPLEPPGTKAVIADPDAGPGQEIAAKLGDYILRTFAWQNSKKEMMKTVLGIPKQALAREEQNFGIVFAMIHPRYLKKQGFKKLGETYEVDYRVIYQRNRKHFPAITAELMKKANIAAQDSLADLLKFTQYIPYKVPPRYLHGRYTREFYTPLQCLERQAGDCDSKAILLADLLGTDSGPGSQKKLALIILKGFGIFHAILAVEGKPIPGATTLYFRGKGYYIPMETTAPGWMPGFVGHNVLDCLKAGFFRFEELN